MNFDVFLLFFNAALTTVVSAGVVIWILRKRYLPVIKRLERETSSDALGEGVERSESARRGE
jgi:hypothetical protein